MLPGVAFAYGSSLKRMMLGSTERPSMQKPMTIEESNIGSSQESYMNKSILKASAIPATLNV